VHLLAFCDYSEDLRHAERLREHCRSVTLVPLNRSFQKIKALGSILLQQPFSLGYFSSRGMRSAVERKLAEHRFDLIFVYCSSMAPYVEDVRGIPRVLDFVDSDACKWGQYAAAMRPPFSWLYAYEAARLKEYEIRIAERFDACAFVSAREAGHMPPQVRSRVAFIQNGIDLASFPPSLKDPASRRIVFTGAMDYFPNVDAVRFFASEIFPRIRRQFPDAGFWIVGSRPSKPVLSLAKIPGVTVTGTVSDVRPYLAAARVAVVPLRISQGIQNKILEAFAAGLPVVASSNAAAGLAPMPHAPLAVAEDPARFAESVIEFLSRPPLSAGEIQLCRKDLEERYNWSRNLAAFERIIQKLSPSIAMTEPEFAAMERSTISSSAS
jgi:sugar transferase (PEP-CTERM/EpsH1 system associated)